MERRNGLRKPKCEFDGRAKLWNAAPKDGIQKPPAKVLQCKCGVVVHFNKLKYARNPNYIDSPAEIELPSQSSGSLWKYRSRQHCLEEDIVAIPNADGPVEAIQRSPSKLLPHLISFNIHCLSLSLLPTFSLVSNR